MKKAGTFVRFVVFSKKRIHPLLSQVEDVYISYQNGDVPASHVSLLEGIKKEKKHSAFLVVLLMAEIRRAPVEVGS